MTAYAYPTALEGASRDGYDPLPGYATPVECWHVPAPGYLYQLRGQGWIGTVWATTQRGKAVWHAEHYNPATGQHHRFHKPGSRAKRPPRIPFPTARAAVLALLAFEEAGTEAS